MAFSFQKAAAWTHTRDLSVSSPSPYIAHEVGTDVRDVGKAGLKSHRRAIWQTTQGSVGNNPFTSEHMLLVAGTERHLRERGME